MLEGDDFTRMVELTKEMRKQLTDDQNKENDAKEIELFSNPESMQEMLAEHNANFEAADADKDGVLDLNEFLEFCKETDKKTAARGFHTAGWDDDRDKPLLTEMWNLWAKLHPDGKGVTNESMMANWEAIDKAVKS